MSTLTLYSVPADGRILFCYAPGLTKVLPFLRVDLEITAERRLSPALHLGAASCCLGVLAHDAREVSARHQRCGLPGDHDPRMIRATEHLARLATQIRATADTVPPTADTVRMVLDQIDQALAWLGTDTTT